MLQTTGTAYMSKTRPVVNDRRGADFTLDLVLVDNMGRNPHNGRDEFQSTPAIADGRTPCRSGFRPRC